MMEDRKLFAPLWTARHLLWDWANCQTFAGSAPQRGFRERPCSLTRARSEPAEADTTTYVMSSLFLHKCFKYLTRDPTEDLHIVTGVSLDGRFVLNEMLRLPDVKRSVAGAFSEANHVRKGLEVMQSFGLRCGGLFHSHPGSGRSGTSPSSTDWKNQKVWEQAYPLIGGVFSRDGYVRFFASPNHWKAEVHGKRVRKVDENLFKLEVD